MASRSSTRRPDGSIGGAQARVIDFDEPDNNDWLAVNQFTVAEGQHTGAPDVVLFVNGLPLAVIELKNPADENATVWSAFQQLQTYQAQIPALFAYNAALVVSDGCRRASGRWAPVEGVVQAVAHDRRTRHAPAFQPELQVLLEGVFDKRRFLDLCATSSSSRTWGTGMSSRRWRATTSSTRSTSRSRRRYVRAGPRSMDQAAEPRGRYDAPRKPGGEPGDRRVGVVWHTQGSGKSLTMAFYAGRVILHPAMAEPHGGGAHRPQRPRRPALRHLRPLPATCCGSRRRRPPTGPTCAPSSRWPAAGSSSRPSRSSSPRSGATGTRSCPTGATSS
jgi:type I restriction enzyme R subunit